MSKPHKKTSPEKENKKVNADKQSEEAPVREDENNSIYQQDNYKPHYPYPEMHDKQFNNQPEFIDRNSDSKDKS
jgi:hypothetical protein